MARSIQSLHSYLIVPTVVAALSSASRAQVYNCGDPDRSGTTTILDALLIAQNAVSLPSATLSYEQKLLADGNGDGNISIVDALLTAQYSAGLPVAFNCRVPRVVLEGTDSDQSGQVDDLVSDFLPDGFHDGHGSVEVIDGSCMPTVGGTPYQMDHTTRTRVIPDARIVRITNAAGDNLTFGLQRSNVLRGDEIEFPNGFYAMQASGTLTDMIQGDPFVLAGRKYNLAHAEFNDPNTLLRLLGGVEVATMRVGDAPRDIATSDATTFSQVRITGYTPGMVDLNIAGQSLSVAVGGYQTLGPAFGSLQGKRVGVLKESSGNILVALDAQEVEINYDRIAQTGTVNLNGLARPDLVPMIGIDTS